MKPSRAVANFDSSTAMLRSLARFLEGKDFPALGNPRLLERAAAIFDVIPERFLEAIYTYAGGLEALSKKALREVRAEPIAEWIASHYPRRHYPAVAIGSSSGALVHLYAALGVPWLPQTLLIPVAQRGVRFEDGVTDLENARDAARDLLEANPEWVLHQMHDPNQDRLMIRRMTYFRVKRRTLGAAYTRFLEESLAPGGTILVPECRLTWPAHDAGERHFFQLGAPGGATKDEYVSGGPRVARYLSKHGSTEERFLFPRCDGERVEAEWGFEPELLRDIEDLAERRGWRIERIVHDEPEDLSPLVADLYEWWYRERGLTQRRLLVESFVLHDPWWTLRLGAIPYWSLFAVEPSQRRLEQFLDARDPYDFIHMMCFQHGVESVGLAPLDGWRRLLARARVEGAWAGLDEKLYPHDFGTFLRYRPALEAIPERHTLPGSLRLADVKRFLRGRSYPGVSWIEPGASDRVRAA